MKALNVTTYRIDRVIIADRLQVFQETNAIQKARRTDHVPVQAVTVERNAPSMPCRRCDSKTFLVASILAVVTPILSAAEPMLDPATDDPARPWCFLDKSTTVIGVPYMPDVTQVTYDGALYTRQAELCFFYGERLTPLLARQKAHLDGWIPIVQYDWLDGPIKYEIEMFGAVLDGQDASNTCQFVKLTMRNVSTLPAEGCFAAAMRCSGVDHRYGRGAASADWRYAMTDDAVYRANQLIYTFSGGAEREAVPGVDYRQPFAGAEHMVTTRSEVCLVQYRRTLNPNKPFSAVFKMPRVPIAETDKTQIEMVRLADYSTYRTKTERYWRDLFAAGSQFDIPECRVNDALRGSFAQLMLATRERGGRRFQTSGLPYPNFFMIDFIDMCAVYNAMGQPDFARQNFEQIFLRQHDDGLFCDTSLSHGKRLWSSHGHMIHSLAWHCLINRDWDLAREIYPRLQRAVQWVDSARKQDEYGLMPPAWPYDAEMIKGRYTSHNLWTLLGLRSAIRLARAIGNRSDVQAWTKLHDEYETSVLEAIQATCGEDGYVPTGLYDFITGPASRSGFAEYQTNQDWENLVLSYPTEVLVPHDPRVSATLDKMHRIKYREGIMTYRNGMHLHQYLTTNVSNQHIVRGEQEQALTDLYHILLHCGSTHEGYENMVGPWTRRLQAVPPPHAWAAAKITLLIRNMLVLEHGGRAGLDEDQRDLLLFSVISPAWARPGGRIVLDNAATEFGPVNAKMTFTNFGATITFDNKFHTPPRHLVVRVPYFVELVDFVADAGTAQLDGDVIRVSPDATRLSVKWMPKPGVHDDTFQSLLLTYRREVGHWKGRIDEHPPVPEGFLTDAERNRGRAPLSFDLVLEAYRHEYQRRFDEHVRAGGPVLTVEPPRLTQRTATIAEPEKLDPAVHGIAVGKPTTASASLAAYPAHLATDGVEDDLASSWQTDPYPAELQIDLEAPESINRVHVFPYWGNDRYYRYTVEASEDGRNWQQIADMTKNTNPATKKGDDHRFEAVTARYVRVKMLYHSLNRGVHLVEVRVFAAGGDP